MLNISLMLLADWGIDFISLFIFLICLFYKFKEAKYIGLTDGSFLILESHLKPLIFLKMLSI